MNKIRSISSLSLQIAEDELVEIQDAVTKIKEIIVQDVSEGISKSKTTKKINRVIKKLANVIKDIELFKEVERSLAISSQRWYYMYSTNIKAINKTYKKNFLEAVKQYFDFKNSQIILINYTYTLDIESILGFKTAKEVINFFDSIRPHLDQSSKGLAVIKDYYNLLYQQIKVIASDPPISNRLTKDGKPYKVNLRNRVEMYIRYTANRQDIIRLRDEGVKLVWTSSHPDASPRCAPFQGKLYSLDGSKGVIDGIAYEPIDDALKGPLGDGNGIITGYNCRHRLIEYTPGSKPPKEYTEEEIKREYAIDQKQRYYENRIRNLKMEEHLMRSVERVEEARKLRKRWRKLEKDYEIFSLQNKRAFYRKRTIVKKIELEN